MKNDGNTMYQCCICGNHTTQLHEIVFGTLYRKISIQYNLQVPLCARHHDTAHGKKHIPAISQYDCMSQSDCFDHFCSILGIDTEKTWFAVKNKSKRAYLDTIKDTCINKIREYEV